LESLDEDSVEGTFFFVRAVTIKEAKAHLNELIDAAVGGQQVVLMRGSKHVAAIVPITADELELAPRLNDEQAARLWASLAEQTVATFSSVGEAIASLRKRARASPRRKPRPTRKR
jgi:prevent-host-death family protein